MDESLSMEAEFAAARAGLDMEDCLSCADSSPPLLTVTLPATGALKVAVPCNLSIFELELAISVSFEPLSTIRALLRLVNDVEGINLSVSSVKSTIILYLGGCPL